jgi:hypothetical protein
MKVGVWGILDLNCTVDFIFTLNGSDLLYKEVRNYINYNIINIYRRQLLLEKIFRYDEYLTKQDER